jgi:hypothetical protein
MPNYALGPRGRRRPSLLRLSRDGLGPARRLGWWRAHAVDDAFALFVLLRVAGRANRLVAAPRTGARAAGGPARRGHATRAERGPRGLGRLALALSLPDPMRSQLRARRWEAHRGRPGRVGGPLDLGRGGRGRGTRARSRCPRARKLGLLRAALLPAARPVARIRFLVEGRFLPEGLHTDTDPRMRDVAIVGGGPEVCTRQLLARAGLDVAVTRSTRRQGLPCIAPACWRPRPSRSSASIARRF